MRGGEGSDLIASIPRRKLGRLDILEPNKEKEQAHPPRTKEKARMFDLFGLSWLTWLRIGVVVAKKTGEGRSLWWEWRLRFPLQDLSIEAGLGLELLARALDDVRTSYQDQYKAEFGHLG